MRTIPGLFLAFCLVLGPSAGYGRSEDAEARAVTAVIKLGGKVMRDMKAESTPTGAQHIQKALPKVLVSR